MNKPTKEKKNVTTLKDHVTFFFFLFDSVSSPLRQLSRFFDSGYSIIFLCQKI